MDSNILKSLEEKVAQLDRLSKLTEKDQIVQVSREIRDLVDSFVNFDQLPKSLKAKLTFFKGKSLSITDAYEKVAEELLSKSIRLDPSNAEAWSALGEVFYSKKDFTQARRCFEGSLERSGPNQDTLRKLSIVYRSQQETDRDLILKSIDLAKQALSLDFHDGESWYILGNAHLTNFFKNTTSYEDLEKAVRSYCQAQKYSTVANPDLHYNKSLALSASEQYAEALVELQIANQLDASLNTASKLAEITNNLESISDMIQKKCNMKKKTLSGLCKTIPIGQHGGNLVSTSELEPGKNLRKTLSLRILGYSKLEFPPIFIACDAKSQVFGLSVYGLPKNYKVSLGCTAFVNDPYMQNVSIGNVQYLSIQVRDSNNLTLRN